MTSFFPDLLRAGAEVEVADVALDPGERSAPAVGIEGERRSWIVEAGEPSGEKQMRPVGSVAIASTRVNNLGFGRDEMDVGGTDGSALCFGHGRLSAGLVTKGMFKQIVCGLVDILSHRDELSNKQAEMKLDISYVNSAEAIPEVSQYLAGRTEQRE